MAATAYAAAVSLLNTMDQIKIHPFISTYFNQYSIESLREKVDSFVNFLEKYSEAAKDLVRRIGDVAHETEEIINMEAARRIRIASTRKNRVLSDKLRKITKEMDCIKEDASFMNPDAEYLERLMAAVALEAGDIFEFKAADQIRSSSSAPPATAMTTAMVGFDGYLAQLLDQLTGNHSGRQILPIVGMGGIGKTTLATNVYQNSLMLHHFDIRAWITVSQQFSARDILLQALSCLRESTSNTDTSDDQLGVELSKILYGRRYLVVLDDVWSVEAWEKIMFFFPENNNGSRIIVTTRESELVDYFSSSAVVVDFLDAKNSWELFCEKTFAEESCPPELEEIGMKIVEKCKGLPLAITVFGGLLRNSPGTQEYWEIIAKDKSLILDSGEGNIKPLSILYSSYKHLPVWLKPCFLYLGLYAEDHEIDVSQLIKLWVAEGFIRSKTDQSLEEIAESYTKELVDRNLLLVGGLTLNKKLKSCRVHDVVRELCMRIGEKENYFCVQRDIHGMRHFIVDEPTARMFHHRESPSILHPLILEGQRAAQFKSRLLRVLFCGDINDTHLDNSSQLVNLRFLFADRLDLSIQLLWSLQTLICHFYVEFWKMPQLRHIDICDSISLPDPPSPTCEDDVIVLQNLQSLKRVKNLIFTEEVCKRIPNIKQLGIHYEFDEPVEATSCYHLHNLGCFSKLESLKLCSPDYARDYPDGDLFKKLKLPSSLKELKLVGCGLVWSDHHMAMIASLRHLQILKLNEESFTGSEWDCVEGGFLCLKHLQIRDCSDLIKWSADSSSFPVLETLSLVYLPKLEEIPSGIGEIPTLERMDVELCSESASMSAVKILEEQQSLGNDSLQLTLKRVKNLVLTEEVCKRIPNIKELSIDYKFNEPGEASLCYHLHNLDCFTKLESLNLCSPRYAWDYPDGDLFKKLKLPSSLKKLRLEGCRLVWSDHMAMIASLPHLQILELDDVSFKGSEWDCVEGVFLCLKHLEICRCSDLIKWSADSSSFPVLETLHLDFLSKLEEIPSAIGEIPTLERMYVGACSESAHMSAAKILEKQESLGNDSLQLTIEFTYSDAAEMFRGKIQQLGITCQNLHIKGGY